MSKLLFVCLGMSLGVLFGACRAIKPDVSVEGAPQACCKTADPKLQDFEGCRVTGGNCQLRRGEKYWMRGAVACGPVDEAACEGGRCCHYLQQYDPSINRPIENWAPAGFDHPTNNVTDPEAKPQHDMPEAGAPPEPEKAAPAEEIEAAWLEEVKRRVVEIDRGEATLVSSESVHRMLAEILERARTRQAG